MGVARAAFALDQEVRGTWSGSKWALIVSGALSGLERDVVTQFWDFRKRGDACGRYWSGISRSSS
jgi:hypothetical protein